MKEYPSISRHFQEMRAAHIFAKEDGSNIRAAWSKKRGWYLFGTTHQLLDISQPVLGGAIPLFKQTLADELTKVAVDQKYESLIVFCEYWGKSSFAGTHVPGDEMYLSVFDLNPYKKGILGPKEFLKLIGDNPNIRTPNYLGQHNWTRGFIERVWNDDVPGASFEGVVAKHGEGHKLKMAKAKSRQWIEKVKGTYSADEAERLINS